MRSRKRLLKGGPMRADNRGMEERDEFRFCTPGAKKGILAIRDFSDDDVVEGTEVGTAAHSRIMELLGPSTNPYWITAQCAVTAYERGLIDERRLDCLTD